ncbi:MAG: hypothetical protein II759_01435 [Lachnospiraceae bacterium]|nr:hypothetical protein [Lachnospiraceae bacterium]
MKDEFAPRSGWTGRFLAWLDGDLDLLIDAADAAEEYDAPREEIKEKRRERRQRIYESERGRAIRHAERRGFYIGYTVIAVICCVLLIGVLLYAIANLPRYGQENRETVEVVERYVEHGLQETGAVNIVAGMILDYRAFDTLGESHVLFTALVCVMILLRLDSKNMRTDFEDYYTTRIDRFHETYRDVIMQRVGMLLVPSIFIYGIYILLNGQNSPGGGFSGGAVLGAGLIIASASFGMSGVDKVYTLRASMIITFVSLAFYSFAKGYVFFTGANGIENHIPKGTPGAILSGGLILPLDIAVGFVVACTMFGFYSLFRRGSIGGET